MDPSIYKLQLIGMDGKEINYHWSSDDTISDKIKDFLDFVEKEVIKDGPSNCYD